MHKFRRKYATVFIYKTIQRLVYHKKMRRFRRKYATRLLHKPINLLKRREYHFCKLLLCTNSLTYWSQNNFNVNSWHYLTNVTNVTLSHESDECDECDAIKIQTKIFPSLALLNFYYLNCYECDECDECDAIKIQTKVFRTLDLINFYQICTYIFMINVNIQWVENWEKTSFWILILKCLFHLNRIFKKFKI